MKKKLLYLDLNGVLLGKKHPIDVGVCLANHAEKFLRYCLKHYDCYWLTDYGKEEDAAPIINALKHHVKPAVLDLAKKIKPTRWGILKTEAIDFSQDFYWIDDAPLAIELEILKNNNALDKWIQVDTRKNYDGLKDILPKLKMHGVKHDERRA